MENRGLEILNDRPVNFSGWISGKKFIVLLRSTQIANADDTVKAV